MFYTWLLLYIFGSCPGRVGLLGCSSHWEHAPVCFILSSVGNSFFCYLLCYWLFTGLPTLNTSSIHHRWPRFQISARWNRPPQNIFTPSAVELKCVWKRLSMRPRKHASWEPSYNPIRQFHPQFLTKNSRSQNLDSICHIPENSKMTRHDPHALVTLPGSPSWKPTYRKAIVQASTALKILMPLTFRK